MTNFFQKYRSIIFDFDGVIADTNAFKSKNIYDSVAKYFNEETAEEFKQYFIQNNGIPREEKINYFFSNHEAASLIIEEYNSLNAQRKESIKLTPYAVEVVGELSKTKIDLYIASGGNLNEITEILERYNIDRYFRAIMTGPKSKKVNLREQTITTPALFVGDSKHDFEVADLFGFEFVFMYQFSQFSQWQQFFQNKNNTLFIKNLGELLCFE